LVPSLEGRKRALTSKRRSSTVQARELQSQPV
jgi:hypothetical protein